MQEGSKLTIVALLLIIIVIPVNLTGVQGADASTTRYSISIDDVNGYSSTALPSLKNPVQMLGTVRAEKFAGQLSAYHVKISWGDGTTEQAATLDLVQNGSDFTGIWTSSIHYYPAAGTFTVTVRLYHMQVPGAESADSQTIVVLTLQEGVVINTSPQGLRITVDQQEFVAPILFNWQSGSVHTISTASPQQGVTGVQYVWASWSDGGAVSHSTTAIAGTITAYFETQYQLTVQTYPAGIAAISGGGWHTADSTVTLEAPAVSGYTFEHWDINGVQQGANSQISVSMSGPLTATAQYKQNSGPNPSPTPNPSATPTPSPTPTPTPTPITSPLPTSSPAPTSVPTPSTTPSPTGSVAPTPTGSPSASPSPSQTATPSPTISPTTSPTPNPSSYPTPSSTPTPVQTATPTVSPSPSASPSSSPNLQTVAVKFGQAFVGSDFVGTVITVDNKAYSGTQLPITFNWPINSIHAFAYSSQLAVGGKRYIYSTTNGLTTLQSGSLTAVLSGTIIGNYKTEYFLDVISEFGNPQGTGWYQANSVAEFNVTTPLDQGNKTLRVFQNWAGDVMVYEPSGKITISKPSTVIASWETQYLVTFNTTLPNLTVLSVPGVPTTLPPGLDVFGAYYVAGSTINAGPAPDSIQGSDSTKFTFRGWTLDTSNPSSNPNLAFVVDKPLDVAVIYDTRALLTVKAIGVSDPFTAQVTITASPASIYNLTPITPVQDWLRVGANAALAVTKANKIGHGDWAVFQKWVGVSQQYSGAFVLAMNSPTSLDASFFKLNPVAESLLYSVIAGLTSLGVLTLTLRRKKTQKWRTRLSIASGAVIMTAAMVVAALVSGAVAIGNNINPIELLDISNWAVVFLVVEACAFVIGSALLVRKVQSKRTLQAEFDRQMENFVQ